jgi:O-6-methylguanine DNA methyltransferase
MEFGTGVAFDCIKTKTGPLYVAASPRGLISVGLGGSLRRFLDRLQTREAVLPRRDPRRIQPYARQIQQYLEGRRRRFTLPIDWRGTSSFQRQVLKAASHIPYGQTRTYGQIARRTGHKGAARAVGQAMGSNPLLLVIPCHRVLGADGSLCGFSAPGGIGLKQRLLHLEGAVFPQGPGHLGRGRRASRAEIE